jgi:hypothetical protein
MWTLRVGSLTDIGLYFLTTAIAVYLALKNVIELKDLGGAFIPKSLPVDCEPRPNIVAGI